LIHTLALAGPSLNGVAMLINRSADGGLTWSNPVVASSATGGSDFDKGWVACDNTASSPHYGNCYLEWDDFGDSNRIEMSTSTDGGATWGAAQQTAGADLGIGGQPVVQPDGTVIVPIATDQEDGILAFHSSDGGASWSQVQAVAAVTAHTAGGGLRTSPLPSAEIDGSGTVYVAWQDCRFEAACSANDIVLSSSSDGTTWSVPARIPIDPVSSGVDHFIPGLAVDPATSGASAHLSLTYFYYPDASCSTDCRLDIGYVFSVDGGASWSPSLRLTGPMSLDWLASTDQGPMVGDYISTSFVGASPRTVLPVATAPGSSFDEAMYATSALPANAPQAAPANGFSFGKLKLNKKRGTATQVVNLPGPGTLALSGAGVKGLNEPVAGGSVKLTIIPVAKKKKQVKRKHSAKIRIGVTFTPPGGSANTQSRKLTLKTKKR
jgi:BNR repeat-like domain